MINLHRVAVGWNAVVDFTAFGNMLKWTAGIVTLSEGVLNALKVILAFSWLPRKVGFCEDEWVSWLKLVGLDQLS